MTTENTTAEVKDAAQEATQAAVKEATQAAVQGPKVELSIPAQAVVPDKPTGDARQDVAFAWMKAAGVVRDSPAVKHAMETGDFALLESVLSEKGAKGFEPYVDLLKGARADLESKAAAAKTAAKAAIVGVFKTEAAWDEARAWVGANADESEREVLSGMLNGGNPVAARIAARFIEQAQLAAKASSAQARGSALRPDAARAGGVSGGAVSPQEFTRELGKLIAEHGDRAAFDTQAYKDLRARRALYRG